jgi:hypothetical protein
VPFPAATFMNAVLDWQHFVNSAYTEGHVNLTSGLVGDMLWTDGGMCGWFFVLCKEHLKSNFNTGESKFCLLIIFVGLIGKCIIFSNE